MSFFQLVGDWPVGPWCVPGGTILNGEAPHWKGIPLPLPLPPNARALDDAAWALLQDWHIDGPARRGEERTSPQLHRGPMPPEVWSMSVGPEALQAHEDRLAALKAAITAAHTELAELTERKAELAEARAIIAERDRIRRRLAEIAATPRLASASSKGK